MVKVTLFTVTFPVVTTVTWSTDDTLAVTVMVWPACMVMAPLALVAYPGRRWALPRKSRYTAPNWPASSSYLLQQPTGNRPAPVKRFRPLLIKQRKHHQSDRLGY